MKNPLSSILVTIGMLIVGFVVSCKSTGTSAPEPAPAPVSSPNSTSTSSPAPSQSSGEKQILEELYEQYEGGIILTGAKEYTVLSGDTLSKIARENYGAGTNAYYFPLIIAASKNSANIVDPDKIEVGMQLIIPDLEKNLNDPGARANLKNLLKDVADIYSRKSGRLSAELYDGLINLYNAM
ncbi:MAG: LysM peptidoglycan-binding domain-containing protein [Treponema sp.]|jgi:LysM repeat protein|nr:LysM peptidoglycan-binding domain-containing protein [Treponema sp.]